MDHKSPEAFRTISEVAEWLGVPTHVLRFWESRFSQVKPVKRAGGRRYYRPADMALLGGIRQLLHEDGMTIRGVQKLLREKGVKHVAAMSPPIDSGPMGETVESNVVALDEVRESASPASSGRSGAPKRAAPTDDDQPSLAEEKWAELNERASAAEPGADDRAAEARLAAAAGAEADTAAQVETEPAPEREATPEERAAPEPDAEPDLQPEAAPSPETEPEAPELRFGFDLADPTAAESAPEQRPAEATAETAPDKAVVNESLEQEAAGADGNDRNDREATTEPVAADADSEEREALTEAETAEPFLLTNAEPSPEAQDIFGAMPSPEAAEFLAHEAPPEVFETESAEPGPRPEGIGEALEAGAPDDPMSSPEALDFAAHDALPETGEFADVTAPPGAGAQAEPVPQADAVREAETLRSAPVMPEIGPDPDDDELMPDTPLVAVRLRAARSEYTRINAARLGALADRLEELSRRMHYEPGARRSS